MILLTVSSHCSPRNNIILVSQYCQSPLCYYTSLGWVVVQLGTLVLEACVFQQSPRLLLLQLDLTDGHHQDAGVRHHLLDTLVTGLVTVNVLLVQLVYEGFRD